MSPRARQHVTVRMYNVGFGDAFLLLFPGTDKTHKVLIDCGSHSASERPRPVREVVEQIIKDVTDDDGVPRIDVVVGTHRHQDHVSGFNHSGWSEVEVTEVWMPWTEDPKDKQATEIRETQSSVAHHLALALDRLGADEQSRALAENSLTNAKAMRTLHSGFDGSPVRRFVPGKDGVAQIATQALGRTRVHVLGPSRDPEVIRDMEPPAGESYLRLLGIAEAEPSAGLPPFTPRWHITPKTAAGTFHLTPRDRDLLSQAAKVDLFALAVALEKAVNGTSLVLMFELGDAYLLFPGDAQWGTWNRMLEDPDANDLIERTTFLKVSHHGSHNGTPKDFVEYLKSRKKKRATRSIPLWAMVSTHPMPRWSQIPKGELLVALSEATQQVARSDSGAGPKVPGFSRWSNDAIEAEVPV